MGVGESSNTSESTNTTEPAVPSEGEIAGSDGNVDIRHTASLRESELLRAGFSDTLEDLHDKDNSGITPRGTVKLQLANDEDGQNVKTDENPQTAKTDENEQNTKTDENAQNATVDEKKEEPAVSVAPPPTDLPTELSPSSTTVVPALPLSTTSSLSPVRNSSAMAERTSPNGSPRSPIPTPTLMRSNSDFYVVEEQRGTLSQSMELYSRYFWRGREMGEKREKQRRKLGLR